MVTQNMSEMELHVRAILGLPIPYISCKPGASRAILSEIETSNPAFEGIEEALKIPDTTVRIFGKPIAYPHRRMAVVLAIGKNIKEARAKTKAMEKKIHIVN